ncbi:MAG: hypothetical protein R2761_30480 [Acidimicrobiales bacterium]
MAEPMDLEDQLRRYADAVESQWWTDADNRDRRGGSSILNGPASVGRTTPEAAQRELDVVAGSNERRWRARRLLTAAAAMVLAVAVVGMALAAVRRAGNTIDAGNAPSTVPADGLGPAGSGGAASAPPGVSLAADRCRQALVQMDEEMTDPNQPDVVIEPMAVPDGVAVAGSELVLDGTARRVVFEFGGKLRSCVVTGNGDVPMGGLVSNEDDAFPVEPDAIQPRGSGGEAKDWVIQGKAGSDVTRVRARFADGTSFDGLVAGGWFIVDMAWAEGGPANLVPLNDVVFTWTLADGTERSSRSEFLAPGGLGGGAPCAADPACIPAKVAEVQAEAARRQAAGEPFDQGPALADGVVSEEEFDAAMASFVGCSVARGLSGYVAPAPLWRDWAIFSLEPNTDPGAVFGYNVLLWSGPGQPGVSPPRPSVTTPSGGNPFLIEECRTTHVDLVSTLVSVQDEKRRFDENAALTTSTTGG